MKHSILTLCAFALLAASLSARRSTMKESIMIKKDFGPVVYAEDFYRLYNLPMYYQEHDLLNNIAFLKLALDAPFDFVHRAITVVETKDERELYKHLVWMQFNYLITKNYIYLAAMYDKQHYYYYNSQFKKELRESYGIAKELYEEAITYWQETKKHASKAVQTREYIELDRLYDKAHKIADGDISYERTAKRKMKEIDEKIQKMNDE